jgi:hypothetical protein
MSRVKCTVQRCHGHASTRAIAALSPLVLVGDRQPHPGQPARVQRAQELDPERARLDLADVQADNLPHAGLVHRIGDDQRLGHDPPAVSDLDLFGVEPQVGVGAVQRPLAKQLDLLIQRPAQRRYTVLGHPVDPQLLDQPVDLASAHPVDIRLQHDRHDRLLTAPPRLQEARKVRAPSPLLGNQQLDLPDPRLPRPGAIPVAMRRPTIRRDLPQPGADLSPDLRLHQRPRDQRNRLAREILKPTIAHLRNDIGNRHPLNLGHRGVSNSSDLL